MTRVLLLGVSPPAMTALDRLGVEYDLVSHAEEVSRLDSLKPHRLRRVHVGDYRDPAILALLPLTGDDYELVVSFTEYGLFPAAVMNAALGLDAAGLAPAYRTRNKLVMRATLAAAGRPGPRYGHGRPPADLDGVIVKPVGGVSSIGIRKIDRSDFDTLGSGDYWEEYLPGAEYSVEAITAGGRHRVLGVTAKATTGAPGYVEVGHLFPAPLTPDAGRAIAAYTSDVLTVLGVVRGASHTEVRLGPDGPRVIEVHTRPGGDNIPRLVMMATGVDQYEAALRADLGRPPAAPAPVTAPDGAASVYGIGVMTLDDILDVPGLTLIDRRTLPADGPGSDARTANAVVTGDREALLTLMDRLEPHGVRRQRPEAAGRR